MTARLCQEVWILKLLTPEDTIVTFNYDLVIEEAFSDPCQVWRPNDGYGFKAHGTTRGWSKKWITSHHPGSSAQKPLALLKLHGSLNWRLYDGNKQVRLKDRPYVVRRNSKGVPATEEVAILPPGWKKPIQDKPYNALWRLAGDAMQKCKSIVILGYSLPDTDLLAQSLFAEIVRSRAARGAKKTLKQLHLADPDEAVKERFSRLFSPALGSSGAVFKYKNIQKFSVHFSRGTGDTADQPIHGGAV